MSSDSALVRALCRVSRWDLAGFVAVVVVTFVASDMSNARHVAVGLVALLTAFVTLVCSSFVARSRSQRRDQPRRVGLQPTLLPHRNPIDEVIDEVSDRKSADGDRNRDRRASRLRE